MVSVRHPLKRLRGQAVASGTLSTRQPHVDFPRDPRDAISVLFAEHGETIYRLGRRICYDPQHAEDLVQETFLQAFRSWPRFEGRSTPLTWLYTIAARVCRRMERRRAAEPRRIESLSTLLDSLPEPAEWNRGNAESPLDVAARHEEEDRLRRAISELPTRFRLPLVLKELEGLSIREVADILGVQEGTVKSRLHRARLVLRESVPAAAPPTSMERAEHSRRECSDLLAAKLEAMARGADFPVENEHVCARCASALDALDRSAELCADLELPVLPDDLRERVTRTLAQLHHD